MVESFEPLGGKKTDSSNASDSTSESQPGEPTKDLQKDLKKDNGDFGTVMWEFFRSIPWKMAAFVFILFIVINSTIFIEYFLEPFGSTYEAGQITDKGVYLQGMFLVIGYMVVYGLASTGIV